MLVMLIEQLWIWPDKYHPLCLARLLAMRMADKVHPAVRQAQGSAFQQKISGSLACLVLLVPWLSILLIFISLAEFPVFFDGLLLLVSIQFQGFIKQGKKISSALVNNKKVLARHLLAQIVLRETDKLSVVGIAKGTIESLLLRFNQQFSSVIFWYFVLGGLGALSYRLLYEFSHCWNIKQVRFVHFGQPLAHLVQLLQWLPIRLACGALVVGQNVSTAIQAYRSLVAKNGKHGTAHMLLLSLQGGALGIELSGPAYYDGKKIRSAKCAGDREARPVDIERTIHAIQKAKVVMVVVSFLVGAVLYAWQ
jgi:adenosylcobinamide-phosphate synthase